MNKLKQLPVGKQVSLAFGMLGALVLVIGGLFFLGLRSIERSTQLEQARALNKLAVIDDQAEDVGQFQAKVLWHILATDPEEIKGIDQKLSDSKKTNFDELTDYHKFVDTENEKKLYARVMQAQKAFWEQTEPVLVLSRVNRDAEATKLVNAVQNRAFDEFLAAVDALIAEVETEATNTSEATARFISKIRIIGDALIGLTILIVVGIGFGVAGVARQLNEDNRLLQSEISERKQAGVSLRESEEKFQQLADNITDTFWIASPDLATIHYISAGYELIWGRTKESLYADPHQWIEAILPEERERVFAIFATLMANEPVVSVEYRIARPDGTVRWVHDRGFQVRDAAGLLIRLAGLVTDITERKQAETALRESELRYHSLFENMLEGYAYCRTIFEQDQLRDFTYLEVNSSFERLTGLKNVVGKKVSDLIPGITETNREMFGVYSRVALTGQPEKLETYLEGLEIWLSVTVYSSEREHFVAVFDNITEPKRAAALLMESERRLTLATESAHIGIWDWDLVTNHLVWDTQMYALYGIRAEDFSGAYDAWQKSLHPEDRDRAEADIRAAVDSARGFHVEFRVVWPGGEVRQIEAHAQVQRADDSSTAHMIGVNWDITERKRAENELEVAHQQLLETSRLAGRAEVATNVLHNVGNVLNSVNISASLVRDRVRKSRTSSLENIVALFREHEKDLGTFITSDPQGKRLPAYLGQLSEHLLADQVTTLQELESLGENIEHIKAIVAMQQRYAAVGGVKEMIDLAQLVDDSLRLNESAFRRHGVEVIREFAPVPSMNVEKHKVLQILVNLLRNAKHACQDSDRPDKRIAVRVANGRGRVRISVTDNGVGIPAENLIRIFHHGFTTRKDGHGFGLHSGALAAKELGGSLTMHSDGPGQGATFTLELPCTANEATHQ